MAQTPYERLKRSRQRKLNAGLVRIEIWVSPENAERIRRFAKKIEGKSDGS